MACATAHHPGTPNLESKSLEVVCSSYVLGYCQFHEGCPMRETHCIHLIDETPSTPPNAPSKCRNILSLEPRKAPYSIETCFDSDGPGILSSVKDARHDNDHVLIQDIRILPTTDEILSLRRPYMPTKAHNQTHHLPAGPDRHLDIAFRQLRYENVEPLIDICHHAMQQLVISRTQPHLLDYQFGVETAQRRRYSLLRNAAFEELLFHEYKGVMVRLSFNCPRALQGGRIHRSGLFEEGMLCALVGLHDETDELSTTFFEVHLRESTDAMKNRTGNHTRAAIQLSFADRHDIPSIRRCASYMHRLIKATFVLVDLPNVLLAGFALHLDRLQKLALDPNFAFSSQIAPREPSKVVPILPPKYATELNFRYNLQDLRAEKNDKATFTMQPTQHTSNNDESQSTIKAILARTSLDQGQAVALYENLNRGLGMTQGPPGTGKTFLGVAFAQVILASQSKAKPQPILIASQTNRACDDFLLDLSKKGITKIARLGGASKVEWVKPHLLRELTSKMRLTTIERHDVNVARRQVDHLARDGLGWAEALCKDMLGWHSLKDHIRTHHAKIYNHFASLETIDSDTTDLRRTKRYSGFAYEFWVSGGDIKDVNALLEVLDTLLGHCEVSNRSASSSSQFKEQIFAAVKCNTRVATAIASGDQIWSLSLEERHCLVNQWIQELNPWKVCEAFAELHRRHQAALSRKKQAHLAIDARCLAQQQIIGLTSTGVAQNWDLLNSLKLRTLITEEASECLESHTICSLFSSIEHALFIGDPLQLRPQVTEMALSTENSAEYRLDESLFERMMFSQSEFPVSKLNVQRRMHPEIADLSRAGDYDYLVDHELTTLNPPVVGMADRMYWLDHKHQEDRPDPRSPMSNSHSNRFEVEFCAAMVRYLIERNGYSLGEIVILTPYNGQLAALAARLRETCSILLSDKDREALIDLDLLPADSNLGCAKASLDLDKMLRIVTVDNFQGEEAKVIIFSAVRSNMLGKVGFLKTRNRINVACSRARDGFYVLGNASLIGGVEHWAKRIEEPAFELAALAIPSEHSRYSSQNNFNKSLLAHFFASRIFLVVINVARSVIQSTCTAMDVYCAQHHVRRACRVVILAHENVARSVEAAPLNYPLSYFPVVIRKSLRVLRLLQTKSSIAGYRSRRRSYLAGMSRTLYARKSYKPTRAMSSVVLFSLVTTCVSNRVLFALYKALTRDARAYAAQVLSVVIAVEPSATMANVRHVKSAVRSPVNIVAASSHVLAYAIRVR
ncbi:hypothetical protein MMC17_000166 [Xylographa soralifera]|nr:hypothetical protein [Xylographa soralifera]